MADITTRIADLGHIKLHMAESGVGGDDLVILLHGFPEFWYTWRKQLPVLGDHYHVVAPDMRGYNLSDRPEAAEEYKIDRLVKDILALATHLGHEKFYLVSHDWGAAVAFATTMAAPERIKGLMVLNGAHPYIFAKLLETNERQIEHSRYITEFQDPKMEEKLLADNCDWLWNWTFAEHEARGLITPDEKAEYIKAWQQPEAVTAMLNYYRMSPVRPRPASKGEKGLNLNPDHFRVKVPTYILWGEQDHALMPENLDGIDEFIPDLTIDRLPNVSHWVTHEAPELVSQKIEAFIESVKGRG